MTLDTAKNIINQYNKDGETIIEGDDYHILEYDNFIYVQELNLDIHPCKSWTLHKEEEYTLLDKCRYTFRDAMTGTLLFIGFNHDLEYLMYNAYGIEARDLNYNIFVNDEEFEISI
jgi:hypothetical protein